MREIKFRALSKNKNKFVNVVGFDLIKNTAKLNCISNIYCNVSLDNLDIELFTGKKDKNGKEIYEKYICKYGNKIGLIEYSNCGFHLVTKDRQQIIHLSTINTPELEIIGNIHENPELLSKGK